MTSNNVELGFAEKRAPWKIRSKFFPSKIGGIPSWLRLNNLPDRSNLLCTICKNPLTFLLQVYAPIIEFETAFHRTIFLFMCPNGKCNESSENFVVLRSQLPRKNEFFSFEPPVEEEKSSMDPSAKKYQNLCVICGFVATMKCDKCSLRDYCCESHRALDLEWNHKDSCESVTKGEVQNKRKKMKNLFLLPEFELVTETEELPAAEPEKSDEEKMREFHQFMQSSKAPRELQETNMDDLDMTKKNDKMFNKFQKRVKIEPEQVLRYQRGAVPLLLSAENIPTEKDISDCSCGAKRIFEFQIMPQLLNYLSLDTAHDSVDWGTLIVYTCSKSCERAHENYEKEFLWKQDFSDYK